SGPQAIGGMPTRSGMENNRWGPVLPPGKVGAGTGSPAGVQAPDGYGGFEPCASTSPRWSSPSGWRPRAAPTRWTATGPAARPPPAARRGPGRGGARRPPAGRPREARTKVGCPRRYWGCGGGWGWYRPFYRPLFWGPWRPLWWFPRAVPY